LEMPVDDDLHEALDEREFLRRSIGPTGLLALKPRQFTSDRDDWHRYLLSQANVRARIKGRLKNSRKKEIHRFHRFTQISSLDRSRRTPRTVSHCDRAKTHGAPDFTDNTDWPEGTHQPAWQ